MSLISWFHWRGEEYLADVVSRIFWPPASSVVIIEREGEILALDAGDYLNLPGGHVKRGETFREAARREAREETGCTVEILEELEESTNAVGGPEIVFTGSIVEESMRGSWEGDPVWVSVEN
ncbi:MAG: NUDIX domain-containing protein, partial [Candidatus Nanohaloarchaea archaeon]